MSEASSPTAGKELYEWIDERRTESLTNLVKPEPALLALPSFKLLHASGSHLWRNKAKDCKNVQPHAVADILLTCDAGHFLLHPSQWHRQKRIRQELCQRYQLVPVQVTQQNGKVVAGSEH